MAIQAIFFDMGGTIETYWHTPEMRREATPGLNRKLLDAGIDLRLSNDQLYQVISDGLDRYHRWSMQTLHELPPAKVWNDYILAGLPVNREVMASIAEDLMLYVETRYYHREMRPEIPRVLESLRQMGYQIGLISNVNSRGQVPTNLEKYGIRRYFDPVVLSSVYGRRKPDPSIFYYAARLAQKPTSRCLYVGDRVARDILGARRAGYGLAVQIIHHFDHGEDDSGPAPHAVIDQMDELIGILEADRKRRPGDRTDRKIKALFFDAGDVLYYRPEKKKKLAAFLGELGLPLPGGTLDGKKELVDRAYQGEISQDEYREALLRSYGVTKSEDISRGKQILEEEGNNVQFFSGVCDTLRALKDQGYLLGIITDTAAPFHIKFSWLEKGGFGDVWDAVISSQELGVRKPSPEIYQAALSQLNVAPCQAVFVGHKVSELDGAHAVGLHTVAFNHDPGASADIFVESFSEILSLPLLAERDTNGL